MATKESSAVEKAVREVCVHHENMNVYVAQGDIVGALTSAKLTANTLEMLKLLISEDPTRALALSTDVCKTAKEQNKVCQLVKCNLDDTMQLVLAQVRELEKKYKRQRSAAFSAGVGGSGATTGGGAGEEEAGGESCGASCGDLERLKQQFSLGSDACKDWFDTVFGLKNAKNDIENGFINPLLYPCMYPSLSKGVLLYGPPGTGKTQLAKAAVNELRSKNRNVDVVFLAPTGADLQGKYVGETEKNIRQIFECAAYFARANERCARIAAAEAAKTDPKKEDDIARKRSIAVLFIDEVDTVGGDRNKDPSGTMAKSVNALLQAMDGIASAPNVVVMAATNKPWSLDTAFLRRFDSTVYVPLPKADDIEALLNLYITRYVKTDCRDPTQIRVNIAGMTDAITVSFKATGKDLFNAVVAKRGQTKSLRVESTGKLVDMAKKLYEQGVVDNTVMTVDDASSTSSASSTSPALTAFEQRAAKGEGAEGDDESSFGTVCKRKSAKRGEEKKKGGCADGGGAPCAIPVKKDKEEWFDLKERELIPLTRTEVAALAQQLAKQKYSGSDVGRLFKHVTRSAAQVALQYGVFYKLNVSGEKYLSATSLPFGGQDSSLVNKNDQVITSAIKFESITVDNVEYQNTKLVPSPTLAIGDSTVDEMYLAKEVKGEKNYRILASIKHKYVDETENKTVSKTLYLQSDIPPVGRSLGQMTLQGLTFLTSLSTTLTGGDATGEKAQKKEREQKAKADAQFAQFIQANLLGQLLANLKTVYVVDDGKGGDTSQKYSLGNMLVDQSETLSMLIDGTTTLHEGEKFDTSPLPIMVDEQVLAGVLAPPPSIRLDEAQKSPQTATLVRKQYNRSDEKKHKDPFLVSWGFNAAQFRDGMAYIRPTAPSQKELDTLALYATDPEKALEQAKQMSKS